MDSNFAIAFTIDPPASTDYLFSSINSGGDNALLATLADHFDGGLGTLTWAIRGDSANNDYNSVESTTDLTDGGPYRVVLNKTGNTASDMEIWVNQQNDSSVVNTDTLDETSVADFNEPVALFASNNGGVVENHIDTMLDDICVFGDSLSRDEIESYANPWGDYFATTGESQPTHDAIGPASVYDPDTNQTHVIYQGANLDPTAATYDHGTETWTEPRVVASNPLSTDDHGAPSITRTSDGTLHVFYGSHDSGQEYARSDNPSDTSNWTVQPSIGTDETYPAPVVVNDDIYLITRDRPGGDYRTRLWKSTDGGDSWSVTTLAVFNQTSNEERIYHYRPTLHNGFIHYAFLYHNGDTTDGQETATRYNVYHAKIDTSDDSLQTQDGAVLSTPIDKPTADSELLVVDSESANEETNNIAMDVDGNGNPHFIYNRFESSDETWHLDYVRWDGTGWTTPTRIVQLGAGAATDTTQTKFARSDLRVTSASDITAWVPITVSGSRGGDVTEWHYDGSSWSQQSTILSSSEASRPVGNCVRTMPDGDSEIEVLFSEIDEGDYDNSDLAVYAYGGNGIVKD